MGTPSSPESAKPGRASWTEEAREHVACSGLPPFWVPGGAGIAGRVHPTLAAPLSSKPRRLSRFVPDPTDLAGFPPFAVLSLLWRCYPWLAVPFHGKTGPRQRSRALGEQAPEQAPERGWKGGRGPSGSGSGSAVPPGGAPGGEAAVRGGPASPWSDPGRAAETPRAPPVGVPASRDRRLIVVAKRRAGGRGRRAGNGRPSSGPRATGRTDGSGLAPPCRPGGPAEGGRSCRPGREGRPGHCRALPPGRPAGGHARTRGVERACPCLPGARAPWIRGSGGPGGRRPVGRRSSSRWPGPHRVFAPWPRILHPGPSWPGYPGAGTHPGPGRPSPQARGPGGPPGYPEGHSP